MNRLQIRKLVVVRVYTNTEEETCVAAVYNFVVAELNSISSGTRRTEHTIIAHFNEVGLVFLVARRYKSMHLTA